MRKSLFLEFKFDQIDSELLKTVNFTDLIVSFGPHNERERGRSSWLALKAFQKPLSISLVAFDPSTSSPRGDSVEPGQGPSTEFTPSPVEGLRANCPADPEAKKKLFLRLEEALELRPAEIWLDHFRFDGHWEDFEDGRIPGPHPECKYCRGLDRSRFLAELAQEVMNFVGEVAKVGYFAVPFRAEDVPDLVWSLGQSYLLLRQTFDLVSPMLYHRLIKKPVAYISEYVRYLNYQSNKPILPIVQVKDMPDNLPDTLTADELAREFQEAVKTPSMGVAFFSWDHAVEKGKIEVIRELFAA